MNPVGLAIGNAVCFSCSCGGGGGAYVAPYVTGRYFICDDCGARVWLQRVRAPVTPEATAQ